MSVLGSWAVLSHEVGMRWIHFAMSSMNLSALLSGNGARDCGGAVSYSMPAGSLVVVT